MFQTTNNGIPGGFGVEDTNDPTVIRAANLALEAYKARQGTLAVSGIVFDKVTKAESQVVAGTNYRLKFEARWNMSWFSKYVCDAIVYRNFKDELSVTSVDCTYRMLF